MGQQALAALRQGVRGREAGISIALQQSKHVPDCIRHFGPTLWDSAA